MWLKAVLHNVNSTCLELKGMNFVQIQFLKLSGKYRFIYLWYVYKWFSTFACKLWIYLSYKQNDSSTYFKSIYKTIHRWLRSTLPFMDFRTTKFAHTSTCMNITQQGCHYNNPLPLGMIDTTIKGINVAIHSVIS